MVRFPLGAEVAEELATRYSYPFPDRDLVRVAQFHAIQSDPNAPKEEVAEICARRARRKCQRPPAFGKEGEPHGVLATLPLPIFISTNYDDFMLRALRERQKDPRREICRWQEVLEHVPSVFEQERSYKPTPANPLVYHLHGTMDVPESMVLTEDDYLTFLVQMAANAELLPGVLQQAFAASTFLFIGYRLGDWNFRVLFQALRARQLFSSVVVMKPLEEGDPNRTAQQNYFEKYCAAMEMKIYWGTGRDFGKELEERWSAFQRENR